MSPGPSVLGTDDEARGRCPCGGTYEARRVDVNLKLSAGPVLLHDVPQRACPLCGARVYGARTLLTIETVFWSASQPAT